MQAIIMAGGRGTRISPLHPGVPKALIPVSGKAVLERQLYSLKKNRITEITVITGYLGDKIRQYFGDGGAFGVNIEYINEREPLGTAGGLFYAKEKIRSDFLLINCDLVFDMDINSFINFHNERNSLISVTAHPSSHPEDSVLIDVGDGGRVKAFFWKRLERPPHCGNLTNAGIHILSSEILESLSEPVKTDLDRQIISSYVKTGRVYAYETNEYIMDMGTPERLKIVERNINK